MSGSLQELFNFFLKKKYVMKLTHKKPEINLDVNLSVLAILTSFQPVMCGMYGKTKAAVELMFSTTLGSMALACQDMYDVEIADGVTVPVSHLHMLMARSGTKKTTVYRVAMAQIFQFENEQAAAFAIRLEEYQREYVIWDEECRSLRKEFRKALRQKEGIEEARQDLAKCLKNEPIRPKKILLTVTDPTPEALLKELGEYPNLGITSDEGGALYESSLFRKIQVLCTLWCGDNYRVSRVSADSPDIKDPRVGMILLMQPDIHDMVLKSQYKKTRAAGGDARILRTDLTLITEPIDINALVSGDESDLEKFYAIQKKHMIAGIARREKNEPRICMTFAPDAKMRLHRLDRAVKCMMEPKKVLYNYRDAGARCIEHTARIAAVMQVYITPDSSIITLETLEAAILISQWYLNHFIVKMDSVRERSDSEILIEWFDRHLARNGSYDFNKRGILQNGPGSLRKDARLMPVLELLSNEGKVQLWEDGTGTHYVRYISSSMESSELDAQYKALSGMPAYICGGSVFSKTPLEE